MMRETSFLNELQTTFACDARWTKPDIICCRGLLKSNTAQMEPLDPTVFIIACHHVFFVLRSITETPEPFLFLCVLFISVTCLSHILLNFSQRQSSVADWCSRDFLDEVLCNYLREGNSDEKLLSLLKAFPPKLRVWINSQNYTVFECPNHKITVAAI